MTKIALIADTHFGARNGNEYVLNYQKKFLDNILFPYIKKYNIKYLCHLGDLVENRRVIDYRILNRLREDFLSRIEDEEIRTYIIAGNHDCYYKNTNEINSLRELIQDKYEYLSIYDDYPYEFSIDGIKCLLVPWISSDNKEKSLNMIKSSDAKFCFGHFELQGFDIAKGRISKSGLDNASDLFNNYLGVYSGHYHTRSSHGNINYIGSCFSFNWSDYGDYRGFGIVDLETGKITYIKNPYNIFCKIDYDEDQYELNEDKIKNTYCRVKVLNKKSESKFNDFINQIQEMGVIDLLIDDSPPRIEINQEIGETDSTIDFFKRNIADLDIDNSMKESITLLTEKIYQEALEI